MGRLFERLEGWVERGREAAKAAIVSWRGKPTKDLSVAELKQRVADAHHVLDIGSTKGLALLVGKLEAERTHFANSLVELTPKEFAGPEGMILKGRAMQARDNSLMVNIILEQGAEAERRLEALQADAEKRANADKGGRLHTVR